MVQTMAVPAFSPNATDPNFTTLRMQAPAGSIIVLDMFLMDVIRPLPNDPSVAPYDTLAQAFQSQIFGSGTHIVLGYVPTGHGTGATCGAAISLEPARWPYPNSKRTEQQITDYIDYWYQVVPSLDGIFFDEGPAPWVFTGGHNPGSYDPIKGCVKELYSNIYKHVQTKSVRLLRPAVGGNSGPAVLLNATQYSEDPTGEWIMAGQYKACDVALLWETEACRYFVEEQGPTNVWPKPNTPSWWTKSAYAPYRVAHTIYACHNVEDMRRAIALCNQRGPSGGPAARYMFITDGTADAYSRLPTYFSEEVAALQAPQALMGSAEQRSDATHKFYVRDWTETATIHDTGQEPTAPGHEWWTTSDVWNRQQPSPGDDPMKPGSFTGDDQPPSEDIRVGTETPLANYAFARIHRQYPCVPDTQETVNATFLYADFGTGINFVDVFKDVSATPTVQVVFNSGSSGEAREITPGVEWTIPDVGSGHICLAVEISTTQDPLTSTLRGQAPGSAGASTVVTDNNVAQRNLATTSVPSMQGTFPLLPVSFYGIAHNADLFPRTMVLRIQPEEEVLEGLTDTFVEIIDGSGERTFKPCKPGGRILLEDMQPGENRWIGLSAQVSGGNEGQVFAVSFQELVDDEVVNGFTISVKPSTLSRVALENLNLQAVELHRLATAFGLERTEKASEAALEMFHKGEELVNEEYLEFLREHLELITQSVDRWIHSEEFGDPFEVWVALEQLGEAVGSDDIVLAAAVHNQVLQKLDAFITMRQKAQGDEADILQMVRWQQRLYRTRPLNELNGASYVVEESQRFIEAYTARELDNDEYPHLIESLLDTLHQTSEAGIDLEEDITTIQECMESPARLQKAHRKCLLKIQYLLKLRQLGIKV